MAYTGRNYNHAHSFRDPTDEYNRLAVLQPSCQYRVPVWGLPCAPCVETAFAVRIHLSYPYPIPLSPHPLLCRGREIGGRVLTVSIRCTAESSAFRRASIVDGGSRPLAALRGVGRFIVAGRLPISGKTVGRTGGAIFGFISHYKMLLRITPIEPAVDEPPRVQARVRVFRLGRLAP